MAIVGHGLVKLKLGSDDRRDQCVNDSREFLPFRTQQKHYLSLQLRNEIKGALFYFFQKKDNVPKHTLIEIKDDYICKSFRCMFKDLLISPFPRLQVLSTDAQRGEVLYCL